MCAGVTEPSVIGTEGKWEKVLERVRQVKGETEQVGSMGYCVDFGLFFQMINL